MSFKTALLLISAVLTNSLMAQECIRAEPSPEFSNVTRIKNHSFVRKSEQEATERFTLQSGITVTISHAGCEYYVLEFTFNLPAEGHKAEETKFWLQKALTVTTELGALKESQHVNAVISAIRKAQLLERYEYEGEIETIEGYEHTTFKATSVNDHEVQLSLTYVVLL